MTSSRAECGVCAIRWCGRGVALCVGDRPIALVVLSAVLVVASTAICVRQAWNVMSMHPVPLVPLPQADVETDFVNAESVGGGGAVHSVVRARGRAGIGYRDAIWLTRGRARVPPRLVLDPSTEPLIVLETTVGWPWPTLRSIQWWSWHDGPMAPYPGTGVVVKNRDHVEPLLGITDYVVPTEVVWPSAIWTALFWLVVARLTLLSFTGFRSMLRIWRQRCVACGYRLAPTAAVCSECGRPRFAACRWLAIDAVRAPSGDLRAP